MNKIMLSFFLFCFALTGAFAQAAEILPASADKTYITDFMADEIQDTTVPYTHTSYDYTGLRAIPIRLHITDKISTRDKDLYEGKRLTFEAAEDNIFLKRRQKIQGRVSLIIPSGMNGIPYSIILDDFEIPNAQKGKLRDEYQKDGFNRTYFVLPLKWALTFLPPTGSLTNFIFGGHAKITPKDTITLWYFPNWK